MNSPNTKPRRGGLLRHLPALPPRPVKRRRRWIVSGAVAALIAGVTIVKLDRLFYYPSDGRWFSPQEFGLRHEDVYFETADGVRLHGWLLRAEGRSKGTIVHFHGNAANITNHVALVWWLPPAGYDVLMFDYRGYGQSAGRVSREGTIRDGHAALDCVRSRSDLDTHRLAVYGQSLGGAVATVVAAERPEVRALVLDSTFSSYRRIAAMHLRRTLLLPGLPEGLAAALVSRGHDPIDHIGRFAPRPLLVVASAEDNICFAELGRELFEAAGEPKEFILLSQGGHLEAVLDDVEGVQGRILRFLDSALNGQDRPP